MARKPILATQVLEQGATTTAADAQNAPLTRKSQLIALLGQKDGCTLTAISEIFSWKPHTTRAAIAGLRKAGHQIETVTGEGGIGYRIRSAASDGPQAAASGR